MRILVPNFVGLLALVACSESATNDDATTPAGSSVGPAGVTVPSGGTPTTSSAAVGGAGTAAPPPAATSPIVPTPSVGSDPTVSPVEAPTPDGDMGDAGGGASLEATTMNGGAGGLEGAESSGGAGGEPASGGAGGADPNGGSGGMLAGAGGGAAGGGAGSDPGDIPSPAAELDMFRFECPCLPGPENHTGDGNCNVAPEVDRQTTVKMMGGDPDTVYDVTFRVRGLTEPNTYTGGRLEGERFYIGGTTSAAGYTSYMMTVADPEQHYFFNFNPTTGHVHFVLDYEVTVQIRGGSEVTFEVDGDGSVPDGHQVSNFDEMVVPDVPPAPDWYDGQFVQLDVVSVEVAP